MTEFDLHNQWIKKDVPILNLKLTDGRPVSIVHFGHYNATLAGPDFSMGIINIDGVELVGPIEMHLKSSDWYQHNHHLDSNYDNVILHVVREHDADIIQNKQMIPTLELSENVMSSTSDDAVLCGSMISKNAHDAFESMKSKVLQNKLRNRSVMIHHETNGYLRETLYHLLARSFGSSVNGDQFMELCRVLPVSSLVGRENDSIYESIMNASNILLPKEEWQAGKHILWNFKGLRPASFPTIRIEQFAVICAYLLFNDKFLGQCRHMNLREIKTQLSSLTYEKSLSDKFIQHLLINCFIPFSLIPDHNGYGKSVDDAMDQLKLLKPEENGVIKTWKSYQVEVRNAYDSQSLLELYNEHCCRKKCLSCDVGRELLTDQ